MNKNDFKNVLETGVIKDFDELVSYLEENPEDIVTKNNEGIQILHIVVAYKKYGIKSEILEIINNYNGNNEELLNVKNKIKNIKNVSEKVQQDLSTQRLDIDESIVIDCITYGDDEKHLDKHLDRLALLAVLHGTQLAYSAILALGFESNQYGSDRERNIIERFESSYGFNVVREIRKNIKNSGYFKAIKYNEIGDIYWKMEDDRNAAEAYKQAIKLDPNEPDYHYNLGMAYYVEDKDDDASKEFEKALDLYPEDPMAYRMLGQAYYFCGKSDDAIDKLEQAIRMGQRDPECYFYLGQAYFDCYQYDNALDFTQQAIALNPNDAYYYSFLGEIYEEYKEYDKAINAYKKAVDLDPYNMSFRDDLQKAYQAKQQYEDEINAGTERPKKRLKKDGNTLDLT